LFNSILLFDIPKDLSDIFLKYILGYIPSCNSNFFFNYFVDHKIVNISLDLIKNYTAEITNNIYYFGRFAIKQILVEKDIDIYRYKKIIKFSLIFIEDIRYFNNSSIFLYRKY
jgi:hypothetical protein